MRAQSNNVYRSFPDDAAPTRYSARPSAPSPYRNAQPRPPAPRADPPPPAPPKAPPRNPEAAKERKRLEKLEAIRVAAINTRVCEVVRSVALEIGDEGLLERTEAVLKRRSLTGPVTGGPKKPVRRYTIYPGEQLGAAINARAKAECVDRKLLIDRILSEALGVPLDSVALKPSP